MWHRGRCGAPGWRRRQEAGRGSQRTMEAGLEKPAQEGVEGGTEGGATGGQGGPELTVLGETCLRLPSRVKGYLESSLL